LRAIVAISHLRKLSIFAHSIGKSAIILSWQAEH
jgi:hypothetical protein